MLLFGLTYPSNVSNTSCISFCGSSPSCSGSLRFRYIFKQSFSIADLKVAMQLFMGLQSSLVATSKSSRCLLKNSQLFTRSLVHSIVAGNGMLPAKATIFSLQSWLEVFLLFPEMKIHRFPDLRVTQVHVLFWFLRGPWPTLHLFCRCCCFSGLNHQNLPLI